jgi:hypothetical protein
LAFQAAPRSGELMPFEADLFRQADAPAIH